MACVPILDREWIRALSSLKGMSGLQMPGRETPRVGEGLPGQVGVRYQEGLPSKYGVPNT